MEVATFSQRFISQCKQAWLMLVLTALSVIVWAIFLLKDGSPGLFLKLNQYYTPLADEFFHYYTYVGDGLTFTVVALIMLAFYRNRWYFFTLLASTLGAAFVTQIPKRLLFANVDRPLAHFEAIGVKIRLVEGVTVHHHNSFPSGHTITGFAMFTLLSILIPVRALQPLFFFLAFLVGYSRIYLSQHFPLDVFVGTILGTLVSLVACSIWLPLTEHNSIAKPKPLVKRS